MPRSSSCVVPPIWSLDGAKPWASAQVLMSGRGSVLMGARIAAGRTVGGMNRQAEPLAQEHAHPRVVPRLHPEIRGDLVDRQVDRVDADIGAHAVERLVEGAIGGHLELIGRHSRIVDRTTGGTATATTPGASSDAPSRPT